MGAQLSVVDKEFDIVKEYVYINTKILREIITTSQEQSFDCLSYIHSHANTLFNNEQIKEIKKELAILNSFEFDQEVKEALQKIQESVELADKYPPLYLLFDGDY